MAKRIKKQFFRLLPLSVVGLLVLALFVGILQNSAPNADAAGALTSTDVEPDTLIAAATTSVTVTFTTANPIPADGKIKVTFGAGFNVAGATGGTCSTMDGGFSTSVALQVVTITRDNAGTATVAGAESCTISGIVNPSSSGTTGTYTIETTDSSNVQIDVDAAVSADTIVDFITSATTNDLDGNGLIDRITLVLGEDVTAGSVSGADFTVTVPAYTVASASRTGAAQVTIVLTEGGSPDTGATPTVTVVGPITLASGGTVSSGSKLSVDGAVPVILGGGIVYYSSANDGTVDTIEITYSENVNWTYAELGQFAIVNNSLTDLDSDGNPDSANIVSNSLVLTTSGTSWLTGVSGGTEPTIAYTQGTAVNRIQDAAGNYAPSFSAIPIDDDAQPVLNTSSDLQKYDVNVSGGPADYVQLNFTEAVAVTYVDSDWTINPQDLSGFDVHGCLPGGCNFLAGGYVNLDASGTTLLTGVSGGTEPEISYSAVTGSIVDAGANAVAAFGPQSLADFAKPFATNAEYLDINSDGQIDEVDIFFSENVSYTYDSSDWSVTAHDITNFAITGCTSCTNVNPLALTATADANITGASGGINPDLDYTLTTNAIADLSTEANTADPFTLTDIADSADPLVTIPAVNVSTIADVNVGPDGFWVDIPYTEPMDPLSTPVLAYTPDLIALGDLTLSASSDWTSSTVYRLYYDVTDNNVERTITAVDITSATDVQGNTQVAYNLAGVLGHVDTLNPTLSNIHIQSNNAADLTGYQAKAGDTVYLTFDASETLKNVPPPVLNFYSGGFAIFGGYLVGDGDGTCGDVVTDNTWTACYEVSPFDTEGNVTFDITGRDLADNVSLTYTQADIIDGSAVNVDLTAPSIARITTKTQSGAFPSTDSVLWYNYPGNTFEAYVEGNEPLSEVRVCVRSLKEVGAFTQTCDQTDFNNVADYISSGAVGGTSYTFTGTTFAAIAAGNPLIDMSGYSMNVLIADAAGNVYISPLPAEAFVMVYNVQPAALDPVLNNAGTTDWSTIDDFTNVTATAALTFRAEQPLGTLLGELSFPSGGSLDLTNTATVTAFQSFATNVHIRGGDAANGTADIGVNTTALAAFDQPADFSISVPAGGSQPGLVVYDNVGGIEGYINNDGSVGSTAPLDTVTVTGWVGNVLTFSTSGILSFFGSDNIAPTVSTLSPADNATNVAIASNLVMTFDENVQDAPLRTITIYKSDTTVFETFTLPSARVTFLNNTVTIDPTNNLQNGTSYYVQVTADAVKDMVGNAYAGIANTTTWNFTTVAALTGGGYGGGTGFVPSTANSVLINNGATETTSQTVALSLNSTSATQMMISNLSDLSDASWETYTTSKTWLLSSGTGLKTVYVKYKDSTGAISSVVSDSINLTSATQTNLVLTDPTPAPALPAGVTIGTLVKLAGDDSIYFIDQDNRRHAFPNEAVYLSYYPDFSGVQTISSSIMAQIPLGSNVTMRPGTWLVKIQSDPTVYAVEPYGVLKAISSESIAASLYGSDWNSRIVDVEPTFFFNYQMGSAISAAIFPTGSVFSYQGDSKVYYIEDGKKRYISSDVFNSNKFQNKFIIRNVATSNAYTDGADLPSQGMETIMTLR